MTRTSDPDPWASADPLGQALHFLRMSGTFYCRSEFSAPWGLDLPPMPDSLMLHVVMAGSCWLEVGAAPAQRLRPGDLALVPHGAGHVLRGEPGAPAGALFDLPRERVGEHFEILRHGGGGEPATMVCAAVRFEHPAARHLVTMLPPSIVIDAAQVPDADWLHSSLRLMAAEARQPRPGGETVITRLADILVIQAIRGWIAQSPQQQTGWLGALQDRTIGRAITLMQREPARNWTLGSLADSVALSRSAFAARFTERVGVPAMQYLTMWRMQLAQGWLQAPGAVLADVAERAGYRSEAAFSRAFKRHVGVAPGAARLRTVRDSATP
jgi:AraC-like DNA-binding protein